MGHLPDPHLVEFSRGTGLAAADLNHNFAALFGLAQTAIALALTPDDATTALQVSLGEHERRLAILEQLSLMHERQRNAMEWAPLSHLGAVLVRVQELQDTVEEATSRLLDAHAELKGAHIDLGRRLARVEQRPDAATQEDHDALFKDHRRLAEKEHMLLAQTIALRSEVAALRELALGHDRNANRMEFAPLSTVGHLLQRIMALEARVP